MSTNRVVNCWHCRHYTFFTVNSDNTSAMCAFLGKCVGQLDTVCRFFLLNEGIHTTREIPDYCINYSKIEYKF